MVRSTGEGKVQYRRMSRGGKSWIMSRLYNYDIESDQLSLNIFDGLKSCTCCGSQITARCVCADRLAVPAVRSTT
jgi:hypothetical protein